MISLGWRITGGLAAAVAIGGGGYALGDSAGANRVLARHATATARIVAAADRIRSATDKLAGQAATARTEQVTTERTIYRDAIKIVDRPVFQRICVDADGVQLLDRARDSANRGLTGEPAGAAADASPDTAQR
ncbi:hypothetical protein [Sphingomonas prati]|uniref:Uncharacterized protein n=1 Tax=Sphingomonas prati TaxID=1843237 RepID=A0A7W9F0I2_9SPHN|nr:hypothetical protein [Sphingomonas prati]MBB5728253.1 hypothetical protein [Sphingomonas prati]